MEAFVFLGRVLGPLIELSEIVVKNHTEPNAVVIVRFATASGFVIVDISVAIVAALFQSLLEFGPVLQDELIQHEGLVDGLGEALGL